MADVSKIFKPRRGCKSTMITGAKKNVVLSTGEMFIEMPDSGEGTGKCKMKIGDGVSLYPNLPYAMGDTSNDSIEMEEDTSSSIDIALNKVTNNAKLSIMIAALKRAIKLTSDNSANHNHNDLYYTKSQSDSQISNAKTEVTTSLQRSFQAGVDTIYNACTTVGSTPSSKTPTDCANAIKAHIRSMGGGNDISHGGSVWWSVLVGICNAEVGYVIVIFRLDEWYGTRNEAIIQANHNCAIIGRHHVPGQSYVDIALVKTNRGEFGVRCGAPGQNQGRVAVAKVAPLNNTSFSGWRWV